MNSYVLETIARQRNSETARIAEATVSRRRLTTPRRRWMQVAWRVPAFVHASPREAR